MSRHHNRAILSEIIEKQLDPNKEYVVGKHGLTLSFNEKKKERKEGGQEFEYHQILMRSRTLSSPSQN